jgi:hypothetical protein
MTIHRFINYTVIVAVAALIMWLPALSMHAADQPAGASAPSVSMGGGIVAAGAVEDTLKACLSRIPSDASIGQRMVAETSCQRDEADRKLIQAVPTTEYASH